MKTDIIETAETKIRLLPKYPAIIATANPIKAE
jgi:hypothetical protein